MRLIKTFTDVFGVGPFKFHSIIKECVKDCFNIDEKEFYSIHWTKNTSLDKSTRAWISPSASNLDNQWKQTRDVKWLYTHKDYKFDSINGSIFDSSTTIYNLCYYLKQNNINLKTILDYGCGAGITTIFFSSKLSRSYHLL